MAMVNLKAKVVKCRDLLCDIIHFYKLTFLGGKQCSDLHCSTLPWIHIHAFLFTAFCTLYSAYLTLQSVVVTLYTTSYNNKTLYFANTVVRNRVLWLTNTSLLTHIFIAHRSSAGEIQEPTFWMFSFISTWVRGLILYSLSFNMPHDFKIVQVQIWWTRRP